MHANGTPVFAESQFSCGQNRIKNVATVRTRSDANSENLIESGLYRHVHAKLRPKSIELWVLGPRYALELTQSKPMLS